MTIGGWIIFLFIAICLIAFGIFIAVCAEGLAARIATPIICGVICIALLVGMLWYYSVQPGQSYTLEEIIDG